VDWVVVVHWGQLVGCCEEGDKSSGALNYLRDFQLLINGCDPLIIIIIIRDWDYFRVIQKIREQHARKTRRQGTTENSHIGHCTHTAESTEVKIQ